jgi:hypothetical protein
LDAVVRPLWFCMLPTGRLRASPASSVPLAPPWPAAVALTALLALSLPAALVWHATRLDTVDAWVMCWQDLASAHARGLAAVVSVTLGPAALLTMVAGAVLGWLVRRRT